ncbi:MAG: ammonium transporter, partial [Thermoleophilaceae bacterium]
FAAIKATIGLRVSNDEEEAGLDITEHGMYGYPEAFIPQSEIGAGATVMPAGSPTPAPVTASVRAGEATA